MLNGRVRDGPKKTCEHRFDELACVELNDASCHLASLDPMLAELSHIIGPEFAPLRAINNTSLIV